LTLVCHASRQISSDLTVLKKIPAIAVPRPFIEIRRPRFRIGA
jgi:hypothetical protein